MLAAAGAVLMFREQLALSRRGAAGVAILLALAGWSLLSWAWSSAPALAAPEAERALLYAAALLAFLLVFEASATVPVLVGLLGGATVLSVWGLAGYGSRPLVGPLGYANGAGEVAAIGVVLAAGLAGSQVVTVWGWEKGFYELFCNGPEGGAGAGVQVVTRQPISARAAADQRQINVDDFTTEDAFAQTFTVGIGGWLTDISIGGTGVNAYDQIAITRTTSSGAPDSNAVLTWTTVAHQAYSGNVRLPKQIFVLPGQKLAITVVAPNGRSDPADDYVEHVYTCSNPYPRGAYYSHDQNGDWTEQVGCDNVFATYVIQRFKVGP